MQVSSALGWVCLNATKDLADDEFLHLPDTVDDPRFADRKRPRMVVAETLKDRIQEHEEVPTAGVGCGEGCRTSCLPDIRPGWLFFREAPPGKVSSVASLVQIQGKQPVQEILMIQVKVVFEPLGTDQDQFTGGPLQLEGAPEILIRVG